MIGYQVIGHFKRLNPEDCNIGNLSDGAVFRTKNEARAYGRANMHPRFTVREWHGITHYIDSATGEYVRVPKEQEAC